MTTKNLILLFISLQLSQFAVASSIQNGKNLYFLINTNSKGEKISCTTCHTSDPKKPGTTRANKIIEPMAPSSNPDRFKDSQKTEKWFRRNCNDVLDRNCTEEEKASFIMYLKSIK